MDSTINLMGKPHHKYESKEHHSLYFESIQELLSNYICILLHLYSILFEIILFKMLLERLFLVLPC